ncbi:hypothetical protein DFH09DRAFT_141497 [Mycena vulgaris]|nr:hypothetical protein DFH09DRAFT_141497 [Mycena vulgaris]
MNTFKCSEFGAVSDGAARTEVTEPFDFDAAVNIEPRHHQLLTTNEPPEGSEMTFIQSVISTSGARLAFLKTEISQLCQGSAGAVGGGGADLAVEISCTKSSDPLPTSMDPTRGSCRDILVDAAIDPRSAGPLQVPHDGWSVCVDTRQWPLPLSRRIEYRLLPCGRCSSSCGRRHPHIPYPSLSSNSNAPGRSSYISWDTRPVMLGPKSKCFNF